MYITNNLAACAELLGFADAESLKQTIERILDRIPTAWNRNEESDCTTVEMMETQRDFVTQMATALRRHQLMGDIAEHLEASATAMQTCIGEERNKFST